MKSFQRSRGWTLLRLGRWQVELWFCPRQEWIPRHVHPAIDSRIIFLAGRMAFVKWVHGKVRAVHLTCRNIGKSFRIPHDCPHEALVMGRFGMFLVVERWRDGAVPTSAAQEFVRI